MRAMCPHAIYAKPLGASKKKKQSIYKLAKLVNNKNPFFNFGI